ncbi:acyltransferase [Algiphilus aromaticivorans]|uniref:acyltransferase n=1 Tax=Algiphilus aromaticivorans TaxID=382454 RepID=UPI0005C16BAD|nr:acyltransferase [Algiphilus aromaticivorans]
MLSLLLPRVIIGVLTITALSLSLLLHFLVFLPFSLLKLLTPWQTGRDFWTRLMVTIAWQFIRSNALLLRLLTPVRWDIRIEGALDPQKHYLLISNHQSWADIVVLFEALRGQVPWLRFFLKKQLIYVPVIGFVCWALDYPFMARHSRDAIAKNPELAKEDLETTRRACERFRNMPVTIVNFAEGTRFTPEKHATKQSPYDNLLPPKSGGLAFAISAMGRQVAGLIDVTIVYRPTGYSLVWSFASGEQADLIVEARLHEIPEDMLAGDYQNDPEFRARFQQWVADFWRAKEARLRELRNEQPAAQATALHSGDSRG